MLGIEELLDLEEQLRIELPNRLTEILPQLNRTGQLEEFLRMVGLSDLLNSETGYSVIKNGKILVIGYTDVKENVLRGVVKLLGFDSSRFEFYLDYNDSKTFDFKKTQWNPAYAAILVGPGPHSGKGKGMHSSVITALELEPGYPPVYRMGETDLKITKSNFKVKLEKLVEDGCIKKDNIENYI